MTVSEFKIENHKSITAEVAEQQALFDGTYANEGDKLIDCFLVSEDGNEKLIYF